LDSIFYSQTQATAGGAADFANELVDKEELDGSRKSVTKNYEN
jgi:hypothetical protein